MERFCLDCNSTLKGRADKKFCDDQCRSDFNNRLKAAEQIFVNHINKILNKNRSILKTKNPEGKIKIKKEALSLQGFDFNYHTHTYQTKNGNTYIFCYEYGYLLLENNEVLLIKREEK